MVDEIGRASSGGRERVGYRSTRGGRLIYPEEPENNRWIFDREVIIVAHKPIGTAPNAPLAYALGKKLHPQYWAC